MVVVVVRPLRFPPVIPNSVPIWYYLVKQMQKKSPDTSPNVIISSLIPQSGPRVVNNYPGCMGASLLVVPEGQCLYWFSLFLF